MTIWRTKKSSKQDTELPRFRFRFKHHTDISAGAIRHYLASCFLFNTNNIEGVRCLLTTAHVHMKGAARMGLI